MSDYIKPPLSELDKAELQQGLQKVAAKGPIEVGSILQGLLHAVDPSVYYKATQGDTIIEVEETEWSGRDYLLVTENGGPKSKKVERVSFGSNGEVVATEIETTEFGPNTRVQIETPYQSAKRKINLRIGSNSFEGPSADELQEGAPRDMQYNWELLKPRVVRIFGQEVVLPYFLAESRVSAGRLSAETARDLYAKQIENGFVVVSPRNGMDLLAPGPKEN